MQRRTLISGLAALAPALGVRKLFAQETAAPAPGRCRLITQDVLGPYHIEHYPQRSDVREDQPGVPLTLNFRVVNAASCEPLPGALVTIWHCNADGQYSGVENIMLNEDMTPADEKLDLRSEQFLRGVQTSDAQGRVTFQTVFPGWYYPRVTHIHVRIAPPDYGEVATTQLYLRNADCDAVYATPHYAHRGPNPVRKEPGVDDPFFATEAGDLWLNLEKTADGLTAEHEMGVVFFGRMFGELPDFYRQG